MTLKLPYTAIVFDESNQDICYTLGRRCALSDLFRFIQKEGIETDRPIEDVSLESVDKSNDGVIIGARILPDDLCALNKCGLTIKRATAEEDSYSLPQTLSL